MLGFKEFKGKTKLKTEKEDLILLWYDTSIIKEGK